MQIYQALKVYLVTLAMLLALAITSTSHAQSIECGSTYTIREGDTLGRISSRAYGTSQRWSLIFYSNRSALGDNPSLIQSGTAISIPCLNLAEEDVNLQASNSSGNVEVSFLTASDYRPFTDRSLPNGGIITHSINAALQTTDQFPSYRIVWINDWNAHLDPLLKERQYDIGFPWLKPTDCTNASSVRCEFLFSDPIFEMLIVFFKLNNDNFSFSSNTVVHGKRVCRPSGYYTFDLDHKGRNWLRNQLITLVQPESVKECFQMLSEGQVDLVALNEFTGRAALSELGIASDVSALPNPIALQGLHAVVHRAHPRATVLMHILNEGLRQLDEEGMLDDIIATHLARFYEENS
ncbi:transporter substrate-binding domain-containing protein [Halomonas sp. TRM85114]|uniref:transporter substrate-binding domain-containing protein n=1 Tax=Halomonas jincaotanensis TaxID=2810616 RepID=UPI001BD5D8E0|nr:transporter substrate-binding domain-containing protein [Halomonas jincaotanensis]MBS9405676.1 transporter substrate-binding domain-containing protein [Halomonas jincaotanensis]